MIKPKNFRGIRAACLFAAIAGFGYWVISGFMNVSTPGGDFVRDADLEPAIAEQAVVEKIKNEIIVLPIFNFLGNLLTQYQDIIKRP